MLEAAGLGDAAYESVVVSGADEGTTMPEDSHDRFAKALPREKALDPDTIVAWQLDGEDVPVEHGGPLRLVVPGWYGIWWVKWPQEIRLSSEPAEAFDGFWQSQRYTYQDVRGRCCPWYVTSCRARCVTWPYDGAVVTGDASVEMLAWAGEHAVSPVELSVDDGATWVPAHQLGAGGAVALDALARPPALRPARAACAGSPSGPPTPPAARRTWDAEPEPAGVRQQRHPGRPARPGGPRPLTRESAELPEEVRRVGACFPGEYVESALVSGVSAGSATREGK